MHDDELCDCTKPECERCDLGECIECEDCAVGRRLIALENWIWDNLEDE